MDKNSNAYILIYAGVMTVIVAVTLALLAEALKAPQQANELLAKKTDILKSVGKGDAENPEKVFAERVKGVVLNNNGQVIEGADALDINMEAQSKIKDPAQKKYPLFIYTGDDNSKRYIIPMRGAGLWGPIWGYIAIQEDFKTVAGVSFGHASETPGLGAEITQDWFQDAFKGKTIMNASGEFVGITVKKGSLTNPEHQVSSISGATITSDGVTNMIKDDVSSYLDYFASQKQTAKR